jgi:CAAX protease family protein
VTVAAVGLLGAGPSTSRRLAPTLPAMSLPTRPSPSPASAPPVGPPLRGPATLVLHLAPGVALLAVVLVTAPLLRRAGLPPVWGVLGGTLLVLAPLELGLVRRSLRRAGRSGWAALGLRRPHRADLPAVLLAGAAAVLLPGLVVAAEPLLAAAVPGGLPTVGVDGLARYPAVVQVATLVLWGVSAVLVGPAVEELYFRGWLLPRLPGGAVRACTVNAVLFGAYHLWQPQAVLTVVATALPLAALVRARGNPVLSFLVHASVNAGVLAALLAGLGTR